jgi:alanyl-tRNA synthetase
MEDMNRQSILAQAEELLSGVEKVGAVQLVSGRLDEAGNRAVTGSGRSHQNKMGSGIVILASNSGEKKPVFVAGVTGDLVKQGYNAASIIRDITRIAGGGGGGKPGMATGGGRDKNLVCQALDSAKNIIGQG